MTLVPHEFRPGEVASSAEVNENFDSLASVFGSGSSADEFRPPGPILLNDVGQLSAKDADFLQIGWNVNHNDTGSGLRLDRLQDGKPATALRIGQNGVEVFTTGTTRGTLSAQIVKVFGITAVEGDDYMFFSPWWHMTINDKSPTEDGDHRLTYVPFTEPKTVYENVWRGAATVTHSASAHDVPSNAVAIQVMVYATATTASGAAIHLYKGGSKHYKYGFICHAYGGSAARYGRSAAQGMVMLGRGAHAGKFIERRTANFTTASMFIQGYYI